MRAAHLILGYEPLPSNFQAPKYVIKARDQRLQQINITVSGFLVTGLIPKGVQQVELPFQHITEEEATPSQPIIKEEEQVVEVLDSEDEFEVFNQPQCLKPPTGDFSHFPPIQASSNQEATGIPDAKVLQHKAKTSLLELLEYHTGGNAPEVAIQTKPPTLPPS